MLLKVCGPVKSWRRAKNLDGSDSHFGFATFENALGVIRALRSISPSRPAGHVYSLQDPKYPLIVTADIATLNHLRSHPEMGITERDEDVVKVLNRLFAPLRIDPTGLMPLTFSGPAPQDEPEEKELTAEEQQALKEKREKERAEAFKERERRLEASEVARIKRYYADALQDKEQAEKRQKKAEFEAAFYRDFDDDKEEELGKDGYYRDRERWWQHRKKDRARERELDARDRRQEEEEQLLTQEKFHEAEAQAAAELDGQEAQDHNAADLQNKGIEIDHHDSAQDIHVTRIMTKEERMMAVKELVAQIPADKEGLWAWSVKWDNMDKTMLEKKIEPFLKKKVTELLEDESKELVKFVMEKIAARGDVQSIYDELAPVLVEETDVFVMKLWRMIIYETEARALGL
ncbi:hypothetical protein HDU91_005837 [Kappamyces sp. JEL0680]|nr:hypothetical protein HDU91_005837 [Kappamyces sp. JEL0680]